MRILQIYFDNIRIKQFVFMTEIYVLKLNIVIILQFKILILYQY